LRRNVYPVTGSNAAPIGQIVDGISGPEGYFVDRHGNLFVSNVTNYTVTMYPRGSSNWTLRYTGLAYPTNVTVGHDGMVYIPDLVGNKVVEYRKGSTRSKLNALGDESARRGPRCAKQSLRFI
jgi:hypothetical protein